MPVGTIEVRERAMSRSNKLAHDVRRRLEDGRTIAFNIISAPGAGKTLLLERTLQALNSEISVAVVTGDSYTQHDAHRLARYTGRLVQAVIAHDGCHLDASQIEQALHAIDLDYTDLLLIENVGNLVCPMAWDLGETAKVVLYSVTEGDDKPVKYPNVFRRADYAIFTKVDLLPHLEFDLGRAVGHARDLNPNLGIFYTSARTGEGMDEWFDFLRHRVNEVHIPLP